MTRGRRRTRRPHRARRPGVTGNPVVRDFLLGTSGKIIEILLVGAGAFLLIDGLLFGSRGKIIGGVLCLGASFGIMYALGQVVRLRR